MEQIISMIVVAFGKLGGLGGTNLPRIKFNCAIPFVTDVLVVNVTALLTNAPAVGVPNWIPVEPPFESSIVTIPVPLGAKDKFALAVYDVTVSAATKPAVVKLPAVILPVTDKLARVPTAIKLEYKTLELKVLPTKLPAFTLEAATPVN